MTRGLEGRCSVQLSYGRRTPAVGAPGFEPGTSCSQSRRATKLRHAPWQQNILAQSGRVVKDGCDTCERAKCACTMAVLLLLTA